MDWGAALTTNISGEKILAGAVIGGGVIVAAAAASVGIAAVGAVGAAACADGDCANEAQAISTTVTKAGESADDLIPTTGKIVQPLNVVDKSRSVDQFLNDANKFLGDKYQQIASGIYRAEDGLRQVRFTDSDIQAMNSRSLGSHGHFELLNNVGKVIKNIHIPLIGK